MTPTATAIEVQERNSAGSKAVLQGCQCHSTRSCSIARSSCEIPADGLLGDAAAITAAIGRCEVSVE